MKNKLGVPFWTIIFPILAWIVYFFNSANSGLAIIILQSISLIASVLSAVHHAEVVAHKVGEPFGTLLLAIAVTIIEVSLIVSLMSSGGEQTAALSRDTVFAAIMIILTGIVGICLLVGGVKYREQFVKKDSSISALITLTAILVLTLILPNYTISSAGPIYNNLQLIFVAIVSLILYSSFILIQSVRHRDYFLPANDDNEEHHAAPPSLKTTFLSVAFLLIALVIVVLMAKVLSPTIEAGVMAIGAPDTLVGIIIALVVLLPESIAALKAARRNRLQTSMNLALGSALASIGLTIPAVAIYSLVSGSTVVLGIDTKSIVLLFLSVFTVMLALVTGKTNVLYGIVLLVIFATYLFITIIP